MEQAARSGKFPKSGALFDWLESIENFVGRFDMGTKITLLPAMVEMMVKMMVELVSALASVTKGSRNEKWVSPS